MSSSNDPDASGGAYKVGQEMVVSEAEAAQFLQLGRRGLELIEIIEDDQPMPPKKRLPG